MPLQRLFIPAQGDEPGRFIFVDNVSVGPFGDLQYQEFTPGQQGQGPVGGFPSDLLTVPEINRQGQVINAPSPVVTPPPATLEEELVADTGTDTGTATTGDGTQEAGAGTADAGTPATSTPLRQAFSGRNPNVPIEDRRIFRRF